MATQTSTESVLIDDQLESYAPDSRGSFEIPTPHSGATTRSSLAPLIQQGEYPGRVLGRQEESLDQELSRIISQDITEQGLYEGQAERRQSSRKDSLAIPQSTRRPSIRLETSPESFELATIAEATAAPLPSQGVPPELKNLFGEIVFIFVCSMGQFLYGYFMGNVIVNQNVFVSALGIESSQRAWLIGAYGLANGLSVVISGSLADLTRPKQMLVGAFVWLAAWNVIGAFSISPDKVVLFFIVRAMLGLAIGVLVSASMSVLGRIYNPGIRKTRVFSSMAAMAPCGFCSGALIGGALSAHLPWMYGLNAMFTAACAVAAFMTIPGLRPAKDRVQDGEEPSFKDFDYIGGALSMAGCAALLFGLTQGTPTNWQPYTYSLIIVGVFFLTAFFLWERRARRPLVPNRLWATPGFGPLMISYFLGFGSYIGAWQFYATQFFLSYQHVSPMECALRWIPNGVAGVLATWIVSKTLHIFPGHYILVASMFAYSLGPVFFLPQTPGTSYWALSLPGIILCTFGPDLSFASASIFITNSVPRTYQGSAGSLLMTVQNLCGAIVTAVSDSIGTKVGTSTIGANTETSLEGLRAIWWFGFALALAAAAVCAFTVRIPKSEEKEHAS